MANKQIIKIINEEVSEFNFLNIDEIGQQAQEASVLNSKDFQTKLVHSLITNDNINIKNWEEPYSSVKPIENTGWDDEEIIPSFNNEYKFNYNYNGHLFELELIIEGNNVPVITSGKPLKGDYLQPSEPSQLEYADYSNTDIIFFYEGEQLKFENNWLEKDQKLKNKLIRSIVGSIPE